MPQINLTWQQDDQYDSFSVYRSTSPINDYNLPEPIAENIIEPQYSEIINETNISCYYKIMAKKGNSLFSISNEILYRFIQSNETFNTNITSKYSIISGSPSISWDESSQSINISNGTTQGFIDWTNIPAYNGPFVFEADINFISDSAARKHFGLFLNSSTSVLGYRIFFIDNVFGMSKWVGSTETGVGNFSSNISASVGNSYTIKCKRDKNFVWTVYINGVQLPNTLTDSTYKNLRVGLFVYGCQIKVNEIRTSSTIID